jgi:ABC-2 type transport system permease protein
MDNIANPLIILLAISGARSITNLNTATLLPYYIGVTIFLPFLYISIEETITEMTYTGEINNFLIKPLSFYKWILFREIGKKIATLIIVIPFLLVTVTYAINIKLIPINFLIIAESLGVTLIAFFLSFNFGYILGLLSFWIEEAWILRNTRDVLVTLLGGVALPYFLFPKKLTEILTYSPFPYMVSWPIRVFRDGMKTSEVLIGLSWLVISFVFIRFLWKRVLIRYSGVGG